MLRRLFYGLATIFIAIFIIHPAAISHAQGGLDPTRSAIQGSITLEAGFAPNPHIAQLPSGGDIDADRVFTERDLSACQGYTTSPPTLQLNWSGTTGQLRFEYAADNDSALIIYGPDAVWRCNDDAGSGEEPTVTVSNPPAGIYLIWIASLERDIAGEGTLSIWGSPSSNAVDIEGIPEHGSFRVEEGETALPISVELSSGGGVDIGRNCVGYATATPSLTLDIIGDFSRLVLDFEGFDDNTMMVYTPDGEWLCDDDSGDSLNPRIELTNPADGLYRVWVGSYSRGENNSGTFYVRESIVSSSGGGDTSLGGTVDTEAPPIYGSAELEADFSPDPFTVELTAGGPVNMTQVSNNTGCYGFGTSAPSFILEWSAAADQLTIGFDAAGDTVLLIYTPANEWVCDDDRPETVDPLVEIRNAERGTYRIWVADYSANNNWEGTLTISATGAVGSGGDSAFQLPTTTVPTYGAAEIEGGSDAEPVVVEMAAGGTIRANAAVPSDDPACQGFLSPPPNYALAWTGNGNALVVSFAADTETVLILLDEGGVWVCQQGGGSADEPNTLLLNTPTDGTYLIWVATIRSGEDVRGTLTLTWAEALDVPEPTTDAPEFDSPFADGSSSELDVDAVPEFGSSNLAADFVPAIFTVDITSGGSVSIFNTVAEACRGFTDAAPDFAFDWSGTTPRLELDFDAVGDTVLVVYTPSGDWLCDDDSGPGLSPELVISDPAEGTYLVWVASFLIDERFDGVLEIAETGD